MRALAVADYCLRNIIRLRVALLHSLRYLMNISGMRILYPEDWNRKEIVLFICLLFPPFLTTFCAW